jgi:hypothetical protein
MKVMFKETDMLGKFNNIFIIIQQSREVIGNEVSIFRQEDICPDECCEEL